MFRRSLFGLVAIAILIGVTLFDLNPSTPKSQGDTGFNAESAFADVKAIAQQPHPSGTVANDQVADHIVARLREAGLNPEVKEELGVLPVADADMASMGLMRNITAVLPGSASTGRIVLAAHYDSAPVSPGASDDGAGVAALLEIAKKLPRSLKNDVVFLFTDGEEPGLLGADAFVKNDPLAQGTVVVLNHEARGVRGPALTFRTSPGNEAFMSAYASAVPQKTADSGFAAIMSLLPNGTDFSVFSDAGWIGMDSAFIGGGAYYHTPLDNPANLDLASLHDLGNNSLAFTQELGNLDLASLKSNSDSIFFPAPGFFVHYPAWLELPIALAALLAAVALVIVLRRRKLITVPRTISAGVLAILPLGIATAAALFYLPTLAMFEPGYASLLLGETYQPGFYRAALLVLCAVIVVLWYLVFNRLFAKKTSQDYDFDRSDDDLITRKASTAGAGAVLLIALLGVAMAVLTPGGSHMMTWPALAAALGWFIAVRLRREGWRTVIITLGLAPAAVLLGATAISTLDVGLTIGAVAAAIPFMGLLLLLVPLWVRLLPKWRPGFVPLIALVLVAGLTAVGLTVDRFDATYPRQVELSYALDADTGEAAWGTRAGETTPWLENFTNKPTAEAEKFFTEKGQQANQAQAAQLSTPTVNVVDNTVSDNIRTVKLRITPDGEPPVIGLDIASGKASIIVNGQDIGARTGFTFYNPPATGIDVEIKLPGEAKFRTFAETYDLSIVPGYIPPPNDTMNTHPSVKVFRTTVA